MTTDRVLGVLRGRCGPRRAETDCRCGVMVRSRPVNWPGWCVRQRPSRVSKMNIPKTAGSSRNNNADNMFAFGAPSALAVSKACERQAEGNTRADGRLPEGMTPFPAHAKADGRQVEGDHAFETPST